MMLKRCFNLAWQIGLAGLLGGAGAIVVTDLASAQSSNIVPDGTLGSDRSGVIPLDAAGLKIDVIDRGAIRGSNLFHSFREFNVREERGAYFRNPSNTIQNILARVTGNNRSEILGTLGIFNDTGVTSKPNLFLINPNGILFGPKAALDVPASFVATTANAIRLGDNGLFSASAPASSNLLSVNPSAFFFNAINPQATIVNQSVATSTILSTPINGDPQRPISGLQVLNGQSLLLLGGNVTLDGGKLFALGGQVELGGLAAPGNVELNYRGDILHLSLPSNVPRSNVLIINGSAINVSSAGGGNIAINARNITVGGSQLFAGISSGSGTVASRAGNINLYAAEKVKLEKSSLILNNVEQNATGVGGKIDIQANSILITEGTQLSASTFGNGKAGGVFLQAIGNLSITGNQTIVFSNVESGANSVDAFGKISKGDGINITAGSFSLTNSAQLQTIVREATNGLLRGRGDGADILIDVRNGSIAFSGASIAFSGVNLGAVGKGGNITLIARSLLLDDLSGLNANTAGKTEQGRRADSGNIQLNITDSLSIRGGAQIRSDTYSEGNAGNVIIQADQARITIDGVVFFNHIPVASGISAAVNRDQILGSGTGQAGKVQISSQSLALTNSAIISSSIFGEGLEASEAGKITINAAQSLTLDTLASIRSTVEFGGVGRSGDIEINTKNLTLTDGAQINASLFRQVGNFPGGVGTGGSIQINASDSVILSGVSSTKYPAGVINPFTSEPFQTEGFSSGLFASTERGAIGPAGSITVNTKFFRIADGAVVNSQTLNSGNGGNITINAATLEVVNGGQVLALTRNSGNAGNIIINASDQITVSESDPGFFSRFSRFGRDTINNEGASSGLFANTDANSTGNGGSISLNTTNFSLINTGQISAQSEGKGNAGSIIINARGIFSASNGNIITAAQSSGGEINISARSIRLQNDSDIKTNVANGEGGNIILTANSIIALDDSDILAFAQQGKGGNITLNTLAFFGQNYRPGSPPPFDYNNRVDVNASGTVSGTVTLPDVSFLQNSLTQFSQSLVDPSRLLANSCIVRRGQEESSFNITGSGGLPDRPDNPSTSPFPTGEVRSVEADRSPTKTQNSSEPSWKLGDPIVEPQGVYQLPDGQLVMSRECP